MYSLCRHALFKKKDIAKDGGPPHDWLRPARIAKLLFDSESVALAFLEGAT